MHQLASCLGLLCALGSFLDPSSTQASKVWVSPEDRAIELGSSCTIFTDPTNAMSFEEVLGAGESLQWEVSGQRVPNLGYSDATHWVRLELSFTEAKAHDRWLLEVGWPHLDEINFYLVVSDGARYEGVAGLTRPFAERQVRHRNPIFRLDRVGGKEVVVYLAVRGGNAIQLPLELWERTAFFSADHDNQYVLGFVYGMFAVMLLYSLALYFIVRERAYLRYVRFTASVGLLLFTIDQLAFEYLWPGLTWWAPRAVLVLASLTLVTGLSFFRSYLGLAELWPRGNQLLKKFQYAGMVGMAVPFVLEHALAAYYCLGTAAVGSAVGLSAIAYSLSHGTRAALYLLGAWGPFLLGALLTILRNFQVLPVFALTNHGMLIGASLGIFLLAIAVTVQARDAEWARRRAKLKLHDERVGELEGREHVLQERAHFLGRVSHEMQVHLNAITHVPDALLGDYIRVPIWVCSSCEAMFEASAVPADRRVHQSCPDCGYEKMHIDEDISFRGATFEHMRLLERLRGDARSLFGLVQNVLIYSDAVEEQLGLQRGNFTLSEFFLEVQDLVGREASEKSIAIEYPPTELNATVSGDRDKLIVVMTHLVRNAIQFTPKRGTVQLEYRLKDNAGVREQAFCVRDNGMGIPEDDLHAIFKGFSQVAKPDGSNHRGAGLGLAVVRKLVELHNGDITVESKVGQGSVFKVTIPG